MTSERDRVYINKSDRDDYKALREESDSPLQDMENATLFLLAAVTGFRRGERLKLDSRDGWALTKYFSDEEKSIIKAIAITEEGLSVLLDKNKVYSIVEEYAASGITFLKEDVWNSKYGNYTKKLESNLLAELESSSTESY